VSEGPTQAVRDFIEILIAVTEGVIPDTAVVLPDTAVEVPTVLGVMLDLNSQLIDDSAVSVFHRKRERDRDSANCSSIKLALHRYNGVSVHM
jgi:hypothetical protein